MPPGESQRSEASTGAGTGAVARPGGGGRSLVSLEAEIGRYVERLAELERQVTEADARAEALTMDRNDLAVELRAKDEELKSLRAEAEASARGPKAEAVAALEPRDEGVAGAARRGGEVRELRSRAELESERDDLGRRIAELEAGTDELRERAGRAGALEREKDALAMELEEARSRLAAVVARRPSGRKKVRKKPSRRKTASREAPGRSSPRKAKRKAKKKAKKRPAGKMRKGAGTGAARRSAKPVGKRASRKAPRGVKARGPRRAKAARAR